MNVFITGANRGIGFGFVEYYLAQGHMVWATHRNDVGQLGAIDDRNLTRVQLDVTQDPESNEQLQQCVPERIDLLINNAGVYGGLKADAQSLQHVSADNMLELFNINCIGAMRMVRFLQQNLVRARGIVANMSSKMGSSADNSSGGCYAYRASKAALVICSKSMAIDLQGDGVRVITLHPGWVRTDMTQHSGLIDIEQSISGLTQVIKNIDDYEAGAFVAYDGQLIPY